MDTQPIHARYAPRRILPHLLVALAFLALGLATAVAGVTMGWVLAAFMLWSAVGLARRMRRADPVLTVDADGVHDHRIPVTVRWDQVERMRTVDRRVVFAKVPFLELVPRGRFVRGWWSLTGAVLRGDISFVDARDDERLMFDLNHLDVTPEQVLDAARVHR
jgi:hypothetical protein